MTSRILLIMVSTLVYGSMFCSSASAQGNGLRATAEAGYLSAQPRAQTLFDPDGDLLDAKQRTATAALSLSGQYASGAWRAVGNAWIEHDERHSSHDSDTFWQVPEAYVEYGLSDETSLAAGATIARWGTGYVWNPANPLNDPDANNTSRARPYRRNGDAFVRAETLIGRDSVGIYATRYLQNDPLLSAKRERERAVVLRYQHVLDSGDITGFAAAGHGEQFLGVASSHTLGDKLELHGELGLRSKRRAPQIRSVDVPLPGGSQRLYTWDFAPRKRLTPAALAGGQYTFESTTNVIVEYLYNGNGLSRSEYDRLREAARGSADLLDTPLAKAGRGFLLDANRLVGRMRRHYLFLRVARDQIARATELHYYLRLGLEDGSAVNGVLLRYAFSQRMRAQVSAESYNGPSDAETRLIPLKYRIEATFSVDF